MTSESNEFLTKVIIHKDWIRNDKMNKKDFHELQKFVQNNIVNYALIISKN
jgi:hypothetical protein